MPTVQFGMEVSDASGGSLARQGSGNVGAQAEYDLHTRNNGFNTGRAGSGIVLNWDDRSLSGIGIPGRIGRFQFGMSSFAEGDDGLQSNTDRKDFNTYLSLMPFSQVKNKWISGLTFEYGAWFCNADNRSAGMAATDTGSKIMGTAGARRCLTPAPAVSVTGYMYHMVLALCGTSVPTHFVPWLIFRPAKTVVDSEERKARIVS